MKGTPTPAKTGFFEVQLGKDGPLLYSKKKTGKLPEESDINRIISSIKKQT